MRFLVAVVLAGFLLANASPAYAHTGDTAALTNYTTDIKSFEPVVNGVELKAIQHGEKLELKNTTDEEVTVEGYEGEPYIRAGKDGTFVNTKSPAFFLNQTIDGSTAQPPSADAKAPPEWKKLSSGTTVSWHDHRAHWMGVDDPPEVQSEPGERHNVIPEWKVTMRHGSQILVASGSVTYVPPVSRIPWLVLSAVSALAALAAVVWKSSAGRAVAALTLLLVAGYVAHFAGELGIAGAAFDDIITVTVAAVMGVLGAVLAARRVESSAWVLLFVSALIGLLGGVSDLAFLSNSQLPTTWPYPLARALVALLIGVGIGAAFGHGWIIRRQMTATQNENYS